MKNAILFHGWGGDPENYWFPYIKGELEMRGYEVSAPALPDTDDPKLASWLEAALKEHYDEQTVLIGHSMGCPLILSVLERLTKSVDSVYMVAGFTQPLPADNGFNPMLQETYAWEAISSHARHFFFINSDNDPWGCDEKQGRIMADHLGGEFILAKGQGHMGSESYDQPYREFPLLAKLLP